MLRHLSILGVAALSLAALATETRAQGEFVRQEFIRGQNIQPAFEGWERNADGTFNLVFGYLNRNYEEEPVIPIGANNFFEPGPADRGQPTNFYARRQMYVFKVQVPADWGNKELVWAVTHNGRTDKAIGYLAGFYEIDVSTYRAQRSAASGRASTPQERADKPPTIALEGPSTISTMVGAPVNLAVTVRDEDGLPGPAQGAAVTEDAAGGIEDPRRFRHDATRQDKVSIYAAQKTGLAVTWLHYRGPGRVTFEPMAMPLPTKGGRGTTTVRFSEPGTYVIRAVADDQIFTTPVNVTVNVQAAAR